MNSIEETSAEPTAAAGIIVLSDPSEFETAVRPWDIICKPLSKGPFAYQMAYVTAPTFTFYRETYDVTVSLKGVSPPGMLAFAVPLILGKGSEFWQSPLEGPDLPSTLPGGLDVKITAGHDHIVVLLPLQRLYQSLPPAVVDSITAAAQERGLPSTRHGIAHLGRWLLGRLNTLCRSPELLRQDFFQCSLEDELIHRLATAVLVEKMPPARPSASSRRRALDRALHFLYSDGASLLTVPELSRVAGTSQRTLEYAFRDTFDMSPRTFLIQRRLHAVRRELVSIDPGSSATVSEIAHAHGFHELGRFAGEYKRAFGELPSKTLRATHIGTAAKRHASISVGA